MWKGESHLEWNPLMYFCLTLFLLFFEFDLWLSKNNAKEKMHFTKFSLIHVFLIKSFFLRMPVLYVITPRECEENWTFTSCWISNQTSLPLRITGKVNFMYAFTGITSATFASPKMEGSVLYDEVASTFMRIFFSLSSVTVCTKLTDFTKVSVNRMVSLRNCVDNSSINVYIFKRN